MTVVLDLANNKRNSYMPNLDRGTHHFVVTSHDFEPFVLVVCTFVLLKVWMRSRVRINRIDICGHLIEHEVMRPLILYWQIGYFEVIKTRQEKYIKWCLIKPNTNSTMSFSINTYKV
jgi:hypothetical protein